VPSIRIATGERGRSGPRDSRRSSIAGRRADDVLCRTGVNGTTTAYGVRDCRSGGSGCSPVRLEDVAFNHDQLSVETIEGAQAQIAVLQQFAKREVAVKRSTEQRLDRGV